jgi:hypothetical protein
VGHQADQPPDPFTAFTNLRNELAGKDEALDEVLTEIYEDWESVRDAYYHDRVNSLFVDKDDPGSGSRAPRGCLRTVFGSVEERRNGSKTDDVAFDNQVRSPDDPFVGVAYDSLAAVRSVVAALRGPSGRSRERATRFHAHFNVADSGHAFTGDSIGLALALLTYSQLLKPELLRFERFISAEVAFTGGIDSDGTLTPVSGDTLPAKIERAFYSPVKYIALPQANLPAAQAALTRLQERHPHRHLRLVAANRLAELIDDHNVVRSEKMCMGEFVVKRAYKYSRMAKLQVPLLLILIYALVCLLYPKAWIWFDWNPCDMQAVENHVMAFNKRGSLLWEHYLTEGQSLREHSWALCDLDGDSMNEVAVLPQSGPTVCSADESLLVFDCRGNVVFSRDCLVRYQYPPDLVLVEQPIETYGSWVSAGWHRGQPVIVTGLLAQNPARAYIRFWSGAGDSLGWYINSGHATLRLFEDIDGDGTEDALFTGINNRLGCMTLFTLDPVASRGVSPPYIDTPGFDLTNVTRGNQKRFVALYPSQIGESLAPTDYQRYNCLKLLDGGKIEFSADEGAEGRPAEVIYTLDDTLRVCDVILGDSYKKRVGELRNIETVPYEILEGCRNEILHRLCYFVDGNFVSHCDLPASPSE